MKTINITLLLSAGFLLAAPAAGRCIGTSSALFLRNEPTARLSAMAGASAALEGDAGSVYFNPAGLADMDGHMASFSTWKGLDDLSRFTFISGIANGGALGVFNLSYLNFDSGKEDIYDLAGTESSVRLAHDYALGLGWGYKLLENFSAGAQIKYVKSELAEAYKAKSGTFDAGVLYKLFGQRLSLGAGVQNAAGELKYISRGDPLPRLLYAGGAMKFAFTDATLLAAADVEKPRDQDRLDLRLGVECALNRFFLRVGAKRVANEDSVTLGGGVKLKWLGLDYSFEPAGRLDEPVHKFTVNVYFGGPAEKPVRTAKAL